MKKIEWNFFKDWIFINLFDLISFSFDKLELLKATKGVFISLQCRFIFSRHCPFIYNLHRGKILSICIQDVQWKDKWDSPRHEEDPFISISLFNRLYFNWTWKLPAHLKTNRVDELDYWEQFIWYKHYYDTYSQGLLDGPDLKKAKETWPWRDENNNSTWNDKFLTNKVLNELH